MFSASNSLTKLLNVRYAKNITFSVERMTHDNKQKNIYNPFQKANESQDERMEFKGKPRE